METGTTAAYLNHTRDDQAGYELAQHQALLQRREIIQDVKKQITGESVSWSWASSETKSDILQDIERALGRVSIAELPREELLTIARGVRDRGLRSAEQVKKNAYDAELAARNRAQLKAESKRQLILRGIAYAKRELEAVDDLNSLARWRIEAQVERKLQAIEGDEPWSVIEDQIEEIFESEGIEESIDDEDD